MVGTAALLAVAASCVLSDPPPDLVKAQKHHPLIVRSALSPPLNVVLPALPPRFDVTVELIDPNTPSFVYEVFVDYDGANPRAQPDFVPNAPLTPSPGTTDGNRASFNFALAESSAPDRSACHRIELLVALSFDLSAPHTPDAYGADSVVWFYNPSGDPTRCPLYDAGSADGALPD